MSIFYKRLIIAFILLALGLLGGVVGFQLAYVIDLFLITA